MVSNNGISNPLLKKNGLICSIIGFIAKSIIALISSNLLSSFPNGIGMSKSAIG